MAGIGRQRHGQGCPRGHLFHIQESGCKPARSHWKDIHVQSALACGSSLWSNKRHWFCGAQFFVAVCILILSIFDVSGRGWAVMWKMTPFFCQRTNEAQPKHSRELSLKCCLCPATLQSIIFKLGSLDAIGTYKKRMQRLQLPFFSSPFIAQAQNTETRTHTTMRHRSVWV